MNSKQAKVLLKWMPAFTGDHDFSEDENHIFNELIENLDFIAKLEERDDAYQLLPTEKTYCPKCGESPSILSHYSISINPAFYICWTCKEVRQVGVGLVESGDNEEVQSKPESGEERQSMSYGRARAQLRPDNYDELSAEEQWRIDKALGILDWDGK